jgi:predicted secreted hydrolase
LGVAAACLAAAVVGVLAAAAAIAKTPATPAAPAAFRQALPGYRFSFPRDHASHPDYRTEWWYLTGHLTSRGQKFGYQLTFFRSALKGAEGPDSSRQVYFAHLAVGEITGGKFRSFEKMNRGGLGIAGADTAALRVWNDGWLLEGRGAPEHIRAEAQGASLDLALSALRPPVVHGRQGVSRKGAGRGNASHYYSITRLATRGRLVLDGRTFEVSGLSWMDHEFGSGSLAPDQQGWDWFSVQLADGTDLMIYVMRLKDGSADPASSGTIISPAGRKRHLNLSEFRVERLGSWRSPRSGATYPAGWRLTLPGRGLVIDITPELADQELATKASGITYWEGACQVKGFWHGGRPVSGQAFVELTGYAGPLTL